MITNRSSGKQGYAVAQAALDAGADVTLITSPTNLAIPSGARVIQVHTAAEMLAAVLEESAQADALVMAAAVADFRPAVAAAQKIKKSSSLEAIPLSPTEDVLAAVAARKAQTGFPRRTVGFAAESRDLLANAAAKLHAKHLDLIVANDISAQNAGFEVDTNRVTFLYADGRAENLPLQNKAEVAEALLLKICAWLAA
jgi:phosphopantothenoylcysteine decarboxylase/phosphopantothenate--cysteine ligase